VSHLLLVEDDESLREVMQFNLQEAGYTVTTAADGAKALAAYDPEVIDVVITDLRMPVMGGLELLDQLKAIDDSVTVLVLTAYGSTDRAIEAMRRGAFHYVEKPANLTTLLIMVERACQVHALQLEKAPGKGDSTTIISASPAMNAVLRIVDKIANADATILIRGESGTGKELVARAIHERSDRNGKRFVAVNCAAIPAELLESVLFGHEKGAFTGAVKATAGKFVVAEGGTLFLDEIGEMSAMLQSKLLRVLQTGEIDVVGRDNPRTVDVRVVAATHRDLEQMVADGEFREDLFYRLNVVPIALPALRDRPEDIPVLFRYFARQHGAQPLQVDREVDEVLAGYRWPGNVRELENVVNRMLLLADDPHLSVQDIPAALMSLPAAAEDLPFQLPDGEFDLIEHEKRLIVAALAKFAGNQSATARYLKIPRHVLLYRLEKYDIQ
jgi:two-component system NtrC family response regulator